MPVQCHRWVESPLASLMRTLRHMLDPKIVFLVQVPEIGSGVHGIGGRLGLELELSGLALPEGAFGGLLLVELRRFRPVESTGRLLITLLMHLPHIEVAVACALLAGAGDGSRLIEVFLFGVLRLGLFENSSAHVLVECHALGEVGGSRGLLTTCLHQLMFNY